MNLNLQNWMKDLSETIKEKRVTEISLPGTHDSAAYRFNGNYMPNKLGGVHIGFLEFLRKICPCLAGSILRDWTLTQDYSIKEQLERGIRVFDLRLSYATKCGGTKIKRECCCCCGGNTTCKNELLLSHTFSCITLISFLEQLKGFVDENPSEIVMIMVKPDFVHRNTLTEEAWEEFTELVGSFMGNVMYDNSVHIPSVKECQASGKRVFFNVEFTDTAKHIPLFAWTTLRNNLREGYLHDSPSDEYVKTQIINRLFKSCCTEKKTLRNFSKSAEEFLERYQGQEYLINVWWMDFPQSDMITKLIDFN